MRAVKTNTTTVPANRVPVLVPELPNHFSTRASAEYRKIALPTMEGIHFKKVKELVSLEARGNYTYLFFTNQTKLLVCKTLREMEELIGEPRQFVRIHRSFTINLNMIQQYVKGKGGHVVMEDGSRVAVSAGRKQAFLDALQHYFG